MPSQAEWKRKRSSIPEVAAGEDCTAWGHCEKDSRLGGVTWRVYDLVDLQAAMIPGRISTYECSQKHLKDPEGLQSCP